MMDNFNEKLISLVFNRRPLWDVTCKDYHNREMARKLWEEIGVGLDRTSQAVKGKWQNLRDTFRREHKKCSQITTGICTSGVAPKSTWKFYNQLLFLEDGFYNRDAHYDTGISEVNIYSRNHVYVKSDALSQFEPLNQVQTYKMGNLDSKGNSLQVVEKDEDYYFLMSLLPHLRDIPKRRKLATRIRLQQVLLEEDKQEMQSPNSSESSFSDISPSSPNAMQARQNKTLDRIILSSRPYQELGC